MRSDSPTEHLEYVDLNAADVEMLRASLPGIGPVLADRIVAFRADHGPFSSLNDLERVPGIGPRLAGRLSERVRVSDSLHVPRVAISPLSALSFESPPAAAESAPPPSVGTDVAEGVAVARATTQFPPRRQRTAFALIALVAVLTGTTAGAWLSERKAGAATATVDHEVQVLRADGEKTHEELTRQADALAITQQKLNATIERQKAALAEDEARAARVAKDIKDLADKTRQAQAGIDARVYHLDEAMKLIDWVTTKGYARQVASQGSPSVSP
jgi:competence ComEA-like helix-hairpin-helix protein